MLDGIMGTIDQQVDDKKDLLRANPGMQGTVGKDLIGVMALQKMQKEKQAAENELMLAQQNNPSTIKEQLENEVAGLTQNEMALQTAGIMNQRQQQQQQRRPQQQQQRPQQQHSKLPVLLWVVLLVLLWVVLLVLLCHKVQVLQVLHVPQ